jgi:Mg-chelatase subunit ChlD
MDKIGNLLIGPGLLEINEGALAYHYNNHDQKVPYANANNWRPYAFAPLSAEATFPVQMEFVFKPHADERIQHSVGLMVANSGFAELLNNDHFYYEPNAGIGVHIARTNRNYNNSQIRVYWYEDTVRTEMYSHFTSFQFESGELYSVKVSIDRLQTAVEISGESGTDTFTIVTPKIIFSPDQLFVTDIGGGISSFTSGNEDYFTKFDNFLVTDIPHFQVMLPFLLKNICNSGASSLDVILLLDASGSMKDPIAPNGPTKLGTAQDALVQFLNLMVLSRDQARLVSFSNDADLLHMLSQDRDRLITAVQATTASGISRLDLGLIEAHHEAIGIRHTSNAKPVIIMLTDGAPSGTDEPTVLQTASAAKAAGIEIYTIGFGSPVNKALLEQIATDADHFFDAPKTDDLAFIYQQIAAELNCGG